MNIPSFLKRNKKQKGRLWAYGNRASKTNHDYGLMAAEGYEKNVIVYRCINLIAKNLALPPWVLYEGGHALSHHFLLTLIAQPNPLQTRYAFLEELASYLLIDGNAFVEAVYQNDALSALKVHRPDRVHVMKDKEGQVQGYQVSGDDGEKRVLAIDQETGFSPMLHLKLFSPSNAHYGMSPIQVASSAIDQHNAVGLHNLSLLKNGGRPSGALMMPGSTTSFSDNSRQELKKNLQYFYQGEENAGKVLVLEGGMEWKDIGMSPKDLDFVSGKHLSMREIAQAFGVPSMLVGVPGDSTFSNYREARFHLWEDTVLPLLHMILEKMNGWLVMLYGPTLRFSYDADQIPALTCRRERLWQQIEHASFLTINEKRAALGYSPLKGGDGLEGGQRDDTKNTP